MRAIWLSIIVGLFPASSQLPTFAGTWELDRAASEIVVAAGLAGLGGGGAPEALHITHAANGNLILSSRVNAAEPRVYQVGGSSTVPAADGTRERARSRWEGDRLVIEAGPEAGPDGFAEVFALGPDRRTLTIEVTIRGPDGVRVNTLVYRRAG